MSDVLNYESPLHPEPERRPMVELLLLAGPTVAQMASYTTMQFIDTWMLSRLGPVAPTAAGNSGMMAFSLLAIGMGVLWVVNTLASQHFGAREYDKCGRYMWQGIWFGIAYAAIALLSLPLAGPMFRLFDHGPIEAGLEAAYFRILVLGAVLKMVGTAMGQFLLAINRPLFVLIAAVAGVSVNAVAAWVLVLDGLGFGSQGVAGAAWAQNIGVLCETSVLACIIFLPAIRRTFNSLDWALRWDCMKTLLRVGLPAGVQFVADVLAWSLFCNLVMGVVGDKAMAANTFVFRYMMVSFMPAVGVSLAVTALVGRYIGAKRVDLAVRRANLGFTVTAAYMLCCGLVFLIARRQLMALFTNDPAILEIGAIFMIYAAIYQIFDAMYIIYNGALRGAGDTLVPAVATAVLCWSITVAGGFLVASYVPSLGPGGPWILATVYGILLGVFIYLRFRLGGWMRIHLENGERSNISPNSAKLAHE